MTARKTAARLIGPSNVNRLEEAGFVIVDKKLIEHFTELDDEKLIYFEGKPYIIYCASSNDIERHFSGYMMD